MTNVLSETLQQALDDTAEARGLARELIEAVGVTDMVKQMVMLGTPDGVKADGGLMAMLADVLDETLPALIDTVLPIYLDVYTVADLRDLLAFHRSPVGLKARAVGPALAAAAHTATGPWGALFEQRLEAAYRRRAKGER